MPTLFSYCLRVDDRAAPNPFWGVCIVVIPLGSQLGCEVEITLEISDRRPEDFDDSTVRTIGENSHALKSEGYGFEEE